MKKHLPKLVTAALLSLALAQGANAELLFSDNFDYPVGNLKGLGEWLQYGTKTAAPVQVISQSLTYPGYQTAAVGGAFRLSGEQSGSDQSVFHDITGTDTPKDLYVSALISVNEVPQDCKAPSISFVSNNYKGYVDTSSPTAKGNIFIQNGSDATHFKIGLGKSSTTAKVSTEAEFELEIGRASCRERV